jgi:hypothetical protein
MHLISKCKKDDKSEILYSGARTDVEHLGMRFMMGFNDDESSDLGRGWQSVRAIGVSLSDLGNFRAALFLT